MHVFSHLIHFKCEMLFVIKLNPASFPNLSRPLELTNIAVGCFHVRESQKAEHMHGRKKTNAGNCSGFISICTCSPSHASKEEQEHSRTKSLFFFCHTAKTLKLAFDDHEPIIYDLLVTQMSP